VATTHIKPFVPRDSGGTDIDLVAVRKGRNMRGRLGAALLAVAGKRVVGADLHKSLRAIERAGPAPAPAQGQGS
jgi:hypothetical protein